MEELLRQIAAGISNNNKTLIIPAGSILSQVTVTEGNINLNGLDKTISGVLGREINLIKNNIIPTIKTYEDAVREAVLSRNKKSPIDDFNIINIYVPAVISEFNGREEFVGMNPNGIITLPVTNISIPAPVSALDIRAHLTNVPATIINSANDYEKNFTDEELVSIWNKYLGNVSSSNPAFGDIANIYKTDINELFVVYLITRSIKNTLQDGVRVGQSVYANVMDQLNILLKTRILYIIEAIGNLTKREVLVAANNKRNILVNKVVYDKWLKTEEGDISIILGANLKNAATITLTNLADKIAVDDYLSTWDKYVKLETVKYKNEQHGNYRIAYQMAFVEIVKNLTDEVKLFVAQEVLDNIGKAILDFINEAKPDSLQDVRAICETVITTILFGKTNAKTFIGHMADFSKMNKQLSPEEAASFASLNLIIDYLLSVTELK